MTDRPKIWGKCVKNNAFSNLRRNFGSLSPCHENKIKKMTNINFAESFHPNVQPYRTYSKL